MSIQNESAGTKKTMGMELLTRLEQRVERIEQKIDEIIKQGALREELQDLDKTTERRIEQQTRTLREALRAEISSPLVETLKALSARTEQLEKQVKDDGEIITLLRAAVAHLTRISDTHQRILVGNGNPSIAEIARDSLQTSKMAMEMAQRNGETIQKTREELTEITAELKHLIQDQRQKTTQQRAVWKATAKLIERSPVLVGALGSVITAFSTAWMNFVAHTSIEHIILLGGFIASLTIIFILASLQIKKAGLWSAEDG